METFAFNCDNNQCFWSQKYAGVSLRLHFFDDMKKLVSEFSPVRNFLHFGWIQRFTEQIFVFTPHTEKYLRKIRFKNTGQIFDKMDSLKKDGENLWWFHISFINVLKYNSSHWEVFCKKACNFIKKRDFDACVFLWILAKY